MRTRVKDRALASIVECSTDAIIGKSLDGIIQTWNDAAERVFGYAAHEAVGRHISLVIPPERIAEEDQIISVLKRGERIDHFETERVRKDGRRILVSLSVSPIRDDEGNIVGCSKVVRDITRQRRDDERERRLLAEAAAANAKFQAFFEQGALLAVIMELDGTIVAANRLSWEGCGYRREEIVGKRFWEGPWWASSPVLQRQIEEASAQAIAGSTFRGETPYFVADGSERTVRLEAGDSLWVLGHPMARSAKVGATVGLVVTGALFVLFRATCRAGSDDPCTGQAGFIPVGIILSGTGALMGAAFGRLTLQWERRWP